MTPLVVDSCHSTWFFEPSRGRFRRALKGLGLDGAVPLSKWRPYRAVLVDPDTDTFVVVLQESPMRLLRSWRHREEPCSSCGRSAPAWALGGADHRASRHGPGWVPTVVGNPRLHSL